MKKTKDAVKKPAPKANAEQTLVTETTKAAPKKSSITDNAPKKAKAVSPKPVIEASELAVTERIGLTAGDIWHYLTEQGATPVSKLVKELDQEEKIIQRSIGWLAREGKIALTKQDRIEVIELIG